MGIFSRNTNVKLTHPDARTWRVESASLEIDQSFSGRRTRSAAKSQRRLIHKQEKGKTPRWARQD